MAWIQLTQRNGTRSMVDFSKVSHLNQGKHETTILFAYEVSTTNGKRTQKKMIVKEKLSAIAAQLEIVS